MLIVVVEKYVIFVIFQNVPEFTFWYKKVVLEQQQFSNK
jgi:hypothetical protein